MPGKIRSPWNVGVAVLASVLAVVATNCGRSSGSHGASDKISALIPSGWDGKSDWESPRWKVSDPAQVTSRATTLAKMSRLHDEGPDTNERCTQLQRLNNSGKFLVRVKFFQGGAFYTKLVEDPRIRELNLRPSPDISEMTMELSTIQELDELAVQSHGHTAGCTAVELLSGPGLTMCGTQGKRGAITITHPAYDETINLTPVENLFASVTAANITTDMTTLQGLGTRYYNGSQAIASSNSVQSIMASTYSGTGWSGQATTDQVSHSGFTQRSVVSSLPGLEDNNTTIIIGSHLDSIHAGNQTDAPGADDNASGVAIMAEVMRVLARNNTRFKRRVEWHAYAIEEIGLIGSGQIAANYATGGKKVAAMLQLDMASYAPEAGNDTIHLFHDDTTTGLRRSAKDLLTTYLGGNFTDRAVKVAGTSDHRSWYRAGYPTVFPFEDTLNYNRNMHTSSDTVANANSPALATRMAKLVIAFLSHHAGITGADSEYETKMASALRDPDIKIAVVDADQIPESSWPSGLATGGTVTVFSGPESLEAIEACDVSDHSLRICTSDRAVGIKIEDAPAGRSFFYVVSSGDFQASPARTFGYGPGNLPSHARSISITRK